MRTLAALLLLVPGLAAAQVCNPACASQPAACCAVPAADVFMAYEPDNLATSGIFRGLVEIGAGATCTVDTTIDPIAPMKVSMPAFPVTVDLPGGVVLSFKLQQLVEKWTASGGPLNGAACFTVRTQGFHTPGGVFMIDDGCGTHLVTIEAPTFYCVSPLLRVLCFESRNLNDPPLPLPPGYDRAEDVCVQLQ